jgi:hypothetical protein
LYKQKAAGNPTAFYLKRDLFLDERQKAHKPRAFDGCFDGALLLAREAALLARDDAAVRIDELLQEVDVFVIDVLDIVLCKYVHIIII